ncbi:cytochrome P450 [Apiospora arundinis]
MQANIIFAIVCLFVLAFSLIERYWRLRKIPGPFLASVTDLWRFRIHLRGPVFPSLQTMHQKYGPVVRTGPTTVSISDPAAVKVVYAARTGFTKADSYGPMRVFVGGKSVGSIIDMQDEQQHSALKRAIRGSFISKNLLDYEPDVDLNLKNLLLRLENFPICNLYKTLQFYQLDFLAKIAFSEAPGHLEKGEDVLGLGSSGHVRVSHWFTWHAVPYLERLFFHNRLWSRWFARPSEWVKMSYDKLRTRQASLKPPLERKDLLQKYIEASRKYPDTVYPETIASLVNSTVSAGADTTAGTMTTILYFLIKHPEAHERVLKELREANLSSGSPSYSEAKSPLAVPLERVVPHAGCTVAGVYLPPKTVVGCLAKLIHLDRDCYGEAPGEFRPERWLTSQAAKLQAMEQGFLSWGSGGRVCLGRYIAEMEIKKVISSILLHCEVAFVDNETSLPMLEGIIEFEKNPILVNFSTKRSA